MSSPASLEETLLYKKLKELAQEEGLNRNEEVNRLKALTLVNEVCSDAMVKMKTVIKLFDEYTLHDEVHLVNVTHIMGILLEESDSIDNLNYIEITILILSAYLHDIGMASPRDKLEEIKGSDEFKLFREKRKAELMGLKEFEELLNSVTDEDEKKSIIMAIASIEQSFLTDFIRGFHGDIGAEYIVNKWESEEIWKLEGHNIAKIVSLVCKSHSIRAEQLVLEYKEDYPFDKIVGDIPVNLLYCSLILRLADILDFDRERTPDVLFENISPHNEISVKEWNKHKSVVGWKISDEILFECECTHPVYEKTLRKFLDYIDSELKSCLLIIKDFPQRDGIAERYKLEVPPIVTRSRISAKDNSYSYFDLEFSLSHDEIMKLLMDMDLWGGTSLCVRELIQNAYDAIRHRKAKEEAKGNQWNNGKITLIQRLNNEGKLELVCKDNGIGMDEHILENYFFKVGRSYYCSPEFEQERGGLRGKNVDFDPISQFGIGVLSTFMIGESLKIRTERYLGSYERGKPLEVEVSGFSRMVVIKELVSEPNPGTEITATGKKLSKEEITNDYLDPLQLLGAAQYYAIALDIPINVIIEHPFNPCNLVIEPRNRPLRLKTEFEKVIPPDYVHTIEKDVSSLSNEYEGTIRMSFLKNGNGRLCMENEWGKWDKKSVGNGVSIGITCLSDSNRKIDHSPLSCIDVIAQDGIVICGDRNYNLHFWGSTYNGIQLQFPGSCFVNITGSKKLPLKPNREPNRGIFRDSSKEHAKWSTFRSELKSLSRTILADISMDEELRPDPEDFWKIVGLYELLPYELSKRQAYEHVPFPYIKDNSLNWMTLNEMQSFGLEYVSLSQYPPIPHENTAYIPFNNNRFYPKLLHLGYDLWDPKTFKESLISIIRASTILRLENNEVLYEINPLATSFEKLNETNEFHLQHYGKEIESYLYLFFNSTKGINFSHPAVQFVLNNRGDKFYKDFISGMEILFKNLIDDDYLFYGKQQGYTQNRVKSIMRFWNKFNWDLLPENVKPPYKTLNPATNKEIYISPQYLEQILEEMGDDYKPHKRELVNLD
ncbi:ATP-binding protein [uncultured Methanobacterium sp.]|uniref:HD domain-containing protein n=1 Tax=uncultured Methanobacterium sp. TaxID=176306 RepID=UPI002AA91F6B|nr:ATP-binding protein [uncultured Methanobacterium sp.]